MAAEGKARAERFEMPQFTADIFAAYVGQILEFERPEAREDKPPIPARMQLVEVTRHRMQAGMTREPFSLLFVMRDQPPLSRGLHRLHHDDFEACDLYLERVIAPKYQQSDPMGMYYEAVFN
jgi:hypothetical protein